MNRRLGNFSKFQEGKVWILKKYLVHMDDFTLGRRASIAREKEKNGRYPYHSK